MTAVVTNDNDARQLNGFSAGTVNIPVCDEDLQWPWVIPNTPSIHLLHGKRGFRCLVEFDICDSWKTSYGNIKYRLLIRFATKETGC